MWPSTDTNSSFLHPWSLDMGARPPPERATKRDDRGAARASAVPQPGTGWEGKQACCWLAAGATAAVAVATSSDEYCCVLIVPECNVGLVVEYYPATVETRVRFPDVADVRTTLDGWRLFWLSCASFCAQPWRARRPDLCFVLSRSSTTLHGGVCVMEGSSQ